MPKTEGQSVDTTFVLSVIEEREVIGSKDSGNESISGYLISRTQGRDALVRSKNRSISVIDIVPHDVFGKYG
jgi:hypothetical protein